MYFDKKKIGGILAILRNQAMFKSWTKNSLIKISYFFMQRELCPKTYIWKEGDPSGEIFIVVEGEFRLYKQGILNGKKRSLEIA